MALYCTVYIMLLLNNRKILMVNIFDKDILNYFRTLIILKINCIKIGGGGNFRQLTGFSERGQLTVNYGKYAIP